MTQKSRQARLFTGPVDFTGPVRFFGTVQSVTEIEFGALSFGDVLPAPGDVVVRQSGSSGDLRADSGNTSHAGHIIGIAINDTFVASGAEVQFNDYFFVRGATLYVSTTGKPTVFPPGVGFQQRIGVATATDTILILIGEPIILV